MNGETREEELARRCGELSGQMSQIMAYNHRLLNTVAELTDQLAVASRRIKWLDALEAVGVDNWEGVGDAITIYRKSLVEVSQQHIANTEREMDLGVKDDNS